MIFKSRTDAVQSKEMFSRFLEAVEGVEGFFNEQHAAFWDVLYCLQSDLKISGNLMEIGVLHGRSAVMSIIHAQETEEVHLVDIEYRDTLKQTLARFPESTIARVKTLIGDSKMTMTPTFLDENKARFRWVHIDGEHTYDGVASDLKNADALLHSKGLVCLDDFFNARYPQISDAVFRYVYTHSDTLAFLAMGNNKCYLCRPDFHKHYHGPLKERLEGWLQARDIKPTIFSGMINGQRCFGLR